MRKQLPDGSVRPKLTHAARSLTVSKSLTIDTVLTSTLLRI